MIQLVRHYRHRGRHHSHFVLHEVIVEERRLLHIVDVVDLTLGDQIVLHLLHLLVGLELLKVVAELQVALVDLEEGRLSRLNQGRHLRVLLVLHEVRVHHHRTDSETGTCTVNVGTNLLRLVV